ncbi:MAG: YbaB/EbfC family nucleoid-associated protein [Magnetococcales bacterium]|nr:YbaB/EbfC family nucleoid-associated protein [Magnetococcales bacterium]MBF0262372.1 YbaB/EbfC family nucleoid-associated protein [Magnetococcales bacterium]
MKNIGEIMKQAQAMQSKMAKIQEDLAALVLTGHAGGGMVQVVMNGKQEVMRVRIDPSVVDVEEIEMLEDLVAAAINDAQRKVQDVTRDSMAQLTGGLKIPGLNLPF